MSFGKRFITIVMSVLFAAVAIAMPVIAQEDNGGGSGLSISPTRSEFNIAPGTSQKLEITIRNVTSGSILAQPFVNDFEADNITGGPKLYQNPDKRNAATITKFLAGSLGEVLLKPGERKDLSYDLIVPEGAAPGAYYGAMTFKATPADGAAPQPGEVGLTANVSSLVLIEVPGDITEKVAVTSVKAYQTTKDGDKTSSMFSTAPDKIGITVKNLGNSFAKPFGTVTMNNMFGKQVLSYELNNLQPRGNILPNSSRVFTDNIKGISMPGRYNITANVSHGRGGEIIVAKASFWYLPAWFIAVLAAIVLAVAAVAWWLFKRNSSKSKKA